MEILVLVDFDDFRNEIVATLIRNGYTADGAASATEAVTRVEGGDDDLVLKEE